MAIGSAIFRERREEPLAIDGLDLKANASVAREKRVDHVIVFSVKDAASRIDELPAWLHASRGFAKQLELQGRQSLDIGGFQVPANLRVPAQRARARTRCVDEHSTVIISKLGNRRKIARVGSKRTDSAHAHLVHAFLHQAGTVFMQIDSIDAQRRAVFSMGTHLQKRRLRSPPRPDLEHVAGNVDKRSHTLRGEIGCEARGCSFR